MVGPSSSVRAPVVHEGAMVPLCSLRSSSKHVDEWDPGCRACVQLLSSSSPSELFAILRQWDLRTQGSIDLFVNEFGKRGGNVDDRDALTDMTLLLYACKSGSFGDQAKAAKLVRSLLKKGADGNYRSRWTDMAPIHLASFFGCHLVIEALCEDVPNIEVNSPCADVDGSTPLLLATLAGSLESVRVLLRNKADLSAVDAQGRTALEIAKVLKVTPSDLDPFFIPPWDDIISLLSDPSQASAVPAPKKAFSATHGTLEPVSSSSSSPSRIPARNTSVIKTTTTSPKPGSSPQTLVSPSRLSNTTTTILTSSSPTTNRPPAVSSTKRIVNEAPLSTRPPPTTASLSAARPRPADTPQFPSFSKPQDGAVSRAPILGDDVVINGEKRGIVRFVGPVSFKPGTWVGVQLGEPNGKNNGTVAGVTYFRCKPNHGIMAPVESVQLARDVENPPPLPLNLATLVSATPSTGFPRSSSKPSTNTPAATSKDPSQSMIPRSTPSRQTGNSNPNGNSVTMSTSFTLNTINMSSIGANTTLNESNSSTQNASFLAGNPPKRPSLTSSSSTKATDSPKTVKKTIAPPTVTPQTVAAKPSFPGPSSSQSQPFGVGSKVLINKTTLGTIGFIGTTDFADGMWLGVVLNDPSGKNDGSVGSRRYFVCKENHGLFVRPNKATFRGISVESLI